MTLRGGDRVRTMFVVVLLGGGLVCPAAGCGGNSSANNATARASTPSATPASEAGAAHATAPSGPIDVCAVVTPAEAAAILGPLPAQPPSKTDNVGFGVSMCMYAGPPLSGQGAQTVLARLTVQAGSGKDAPDMLQVDADKRKATIDLPGVGEAAKRSANGMFVWAKQGGITCTAEISNGLPHGLTADAAASQLGSLCGKIFSKAKP